MRLVNLKFDGGKSHWFCYCSSIDWYFGASVGRQSWFRAGVINFLDMHEQGNDIDKESRRGCQEQNSCSLFITAAEGGGRAVSPRPAHLFSFIICAFIARGIVLCSHFSSGRSFRLFVREQDHCLRFASRTLLVCDLMRPRVVVCGGCCRHFVCGTGRGPP